MDERKLIPTLNRPFDVIYSCNKSGNWLAHHRGVITNYINFDPILSAFCDVAVMKEFTKSWIDLKQAIANPSLISAEVLMQ